MAQFGFITHCLKYQKKQKVDNDIEIGWFKGRVMDFEKYNHETYMLKKQKQLRNEKLKNDLSPADYQKYINCERSKKLKGRKGRKGQTASIETRKKMSDTRKGKRPPNYEQFIKKRGHKKGHKWTEVERQAAKQRTHSEETKRKIRQTKMGSTHTEETKRKISKAMKNNTNSSKL